MEPINVFLLDTTLRDGSQGENISFSVDDKLAIAQKLDEFGFHYIEGGWPGSNPRDIEFFQRAKELNFKNARLTAFSSTRHKDKPVNRDPNIVALLEAETPTVTIVGKSCCRHTESALNTTLEENLAMIEETVSFLKLKGREVIYDAEHFFDGYYHNPEYAIKTLLAAQRSGADVLVLCDTNGGMLPHQIVDVIKQVKAAGLIHLGIHTHNDSELAVANTLMAVQNGVEHVQGTINGFGERCGNANLCAIIPNLQLKLKINVVSQKNLRQLTFLSGFVNEIANVSPNRQMSFVGKSAFTHKAGLHVSAVKKSTQSYEHVSPELVGNQRRCLVSDLSGRSNIETKAVELGMDVESVREYMPKILRELKNKENEGYSYEAADGSFELMMKEITQKWQPSFELGGFRILMEKDKHGSPRSEATIRLKVNGVTEHIAAEGNGPVQALDIALRKALCSFYPEINDVHLSDFKVRVLNQKGGTGAKVRVLVDFYGQNQRWGTVGVSENIIEAGWQALTDGYSCFLLRKKTVEVKIKNDLKVG